MPRSGFASLRASSRFSEIYRSGTRIREGGLIVLRSPNPEGSGTRVGFVAGRRVGNAVHRNRAKRRMREAVRRVSLPPATDLILVATPTVVDAPFESIVRWLTEALGDDVMQPKDTP